MCVRTVHTLANQRNGNMFLSLIGHARGTEGGASEEVFREDPLKHPPPFTLLRASLYFPHSEPNSLICATGEDAGGELPLCTRRLGDFSTRFEFMHGKYG